MDTSSSRRHFLKAAALGTVGLSLGPAAARGQAPVRRAAAGVKLGVASYSLRKFGRADAIMMVNALGTPYINLKSFHMPYDASPAELAGARRELKAAGLEIVGGGTITLREDDDDHIRQHFEYAKNAGIPLMVIAPTPDTMPRIERFVKQYDIKVAIHNHGPEDQYFPAPSDGLKVIKDMDPRVGLCVDIGHTTRTGVDVVQAIADAGDRVLDLHIKDLRDLMAKDSQCVVGEGAMPIAAIFQQLIDMNFQGYANLEYEIDADDPLPGMKQSFAYMRGVLAGMGHQG